MATVEWQSSDDANPVSLPTMVSSSDLFDGELFGDELIDIYNSSVEESVDVDMQGIPTLGHPADNDTHVEAHPGAHVASVAAAMDDGLGAFHPSTSFNDLAAFVKPAEANVPVATTAAAKTHSTSSAPSPEAAASKTCKKRSAPVSPESPPAKKKAIPRARKNSTSKKQASPSSKKSVMVDHVPSNLIHAIVSPTGEDAAVSAAVEAAAAAAAAAAASTTFPSLPELSVPAEVTSGVKLSMKHEEKPRPAPCAPLAAPKKPPSDPSPCDSSVSSSANSDTQFKTIAQQAVSNLIMNAGSSRGSPTSSSTKCDADAGSCDDSCDGGGEEKGGKVDTSTAHIKALTGNNWVAACAGTVTSAPPAPPVSAVAAAAAATDKNNRVRRQNLTPDERARQNRDRNREHARNTRLRKKAYVEELKRTLTELVAQRDAADLEKRQSAQRELEQREVRFRVIEEFLKLRGRNETSFTRWAAILEDGFVLTVPSTSLYKNTSGSEVDGFDQKLSSVETVMAESTVFASFLQTLRREGERAITLAFNCDRKNFFMDSCNAVLEWTATSIGAKDELQLKGLMRGKFSPASNKLLSANISFDCGSIMAQLHAKNTLPIRSDEVDVAAAAQADAILDSLEINHVHLNVVVPSDVSVPVHSSASVSDESSSDHGDATGDKFTAEGPEDGLGMTNHRVLCRD